MAQLHKYKREIYSYAHLSIKMKIRILVITKLANRVVLEDRANHKLNLRPQNSSQNNLSQPIKASVENQKVTSMKVLGISRILSAFRNQWNQRQPVLNKQSNRPFIANRTSKLLGCIHQITRQTKLPPSLRTESSYQVKLRISILLATVLSSIYL